MSIDDDAYPELRLHIVLDGPVTADCDKVIAYAKESFDRPVKIVRQGKARNFGGALQTYISTHEFNLMFRMDDDDVTLPGRFARQRHLMESHPELVFCHGGICEFEEPDTPSRVRSGSLVTGRKGRTLLQCRSPFNHVTVCFRYRFFADYATYDDRSPFEDWRLWQASFAKGHVPNILIYDPLVAVSFSERQMKSRSGLSVARAEWEHFKSFQETSSHRLHRLVAFLTRSGARLSGRTVVSFVMALFRKSAASCGSEIEIRTYLQDINLRTDHVYESLFASR